MLSDHRQYEFDSFAPTGDDRYGMALRMALLFGAISLGSAVIAAPLMQSVTNNYVRNGTFGLDRTLTGSVAQRYTIRKSVLVPGQERICGTDYLRSC